MKVKTVSKNYYVEINKCGREGVSVEVGDVTGSSMSATIDIEEFKKICLEVGI